MEQVSSVKSGHEQRLNQIQQQLMLLNERESQVNQVRAFSYARFLKFF
jgi:hypothetical protein